MNPYVPDEVVAVWQWAAPVPADTVPYEDRCWRCDFRRIHNQGEDTECVAGLCEKCCAELRDSDPKPHVWHERICRVCGWMLRDYSDALVEVRWVAHECACFGEDRKNKEKKGAA